MEQVGSKPKLHEQAKYRITVCGIVKARWADYFSGMTIQIIQDASQEPETTLIGWISDQASLLGMLTLLHDWGHTLLSVEYLPSD